MAEMRIHRGDGESFFNFLWNLSAFLLSSPWVKIFSVLYNFPDAHAIPVVTSLTNALHVDTPPVSHATHATYVPFPQEYLRPVYFRKQVYFPLCHQCNLRIMSTRSSSQYSTLGLRVRMDRGVMVMSNKVDDRSRGWPEGSLLNWYYTAV